MYLWEWLIERGKEQCTYEERVEQAKNQKRRAGQPELNAPADVKESVAPRVFDNESLYTYNDTYIDVRTPHDEKRGLITLVISGSIGLVVGWLVVILWFIVTQIYAGRQDLDFYIFTVALTPLVFLLALFLYIKHTYQFLKLESFTARRLIIRFNRITRKVYLLRPPHIGGIRIMDWDKTAIMLEKDMREADGVGGFVWLIWDRGDGTCLDGTPTNHIEMVYIGKPARCASELLAFWEYVRRYMEDGPAAAPAPQKLICKFPWPWLSLRAAWRLDSSFFRDPALWVFVLANTLLLPVILTHAFGHWVSLLLCYEPRFPRAIEEAGRAPMATGTE